MNRARDMWSGVEDVAMARRSLFEKILWNSLMRVSGTEEDSIRESWYGDVSLCVWVKWDRSRIVSARLGRQICN